MSDAMTVAEAIRVVRDPSQFVRAADAFGVLVSHAERTIAARSGEPDVVQRVRSEPLNNTERALLAHIDHLTTQLAAARADDAHARAEYAHWEAEACRVERERKAMEKRLAEAEAKCDALDAKLQVLTDHETCGCSLDKPEDVCMHHSPQLVRLTERLAEVERERDDARGRSGYWESKYIAANNALGEMEQDRDLAATDRDTLVGIVERVKRVPGVLLTNTDGSEEAHYGVLWSDLLAALTPTREEG